MRIVFMGTPDFAVPCLKRLVDDGNEVVGVFTQPDKPKGRGYTLTPPPVKAFAEENGIPVFQPKSMRDGEALEILKRLNPELNVVTAYGKILPPEILYLPKFCSINIHASLLPKYRGAAPIQWCILNGEKETGVTSMPVSVCQFHNGCMSGGQYQAPRLHNPACNYLPFSVLSISEEVFFHS